MRHEYIRELSTNKRSALTVVCGVAKTTEDAVITASLNLKISADASVRKELVSFSEAAGLGSVGIVEAGQGRLRSTRVPVDSV